MEVANVHTLDSLKADPDYHVEKAIPVFRPHVRWMDMNGFGGPEKPKKEKYRVEDHDLEEICRNSNAACEEDCHFPRHTIGHLHLGKHKPEHEQPAKWIGYAVNYRVGTMPNGAKAILADHYIHKDHKEEAKKYPYRSAEYNWKTKRIGGVARLLRDPALGLGTTRYEDETICYAEAVEVEPKVATSALNAGAAPAGMNAGELNPDEAMQADRLWAYYSAKYPGLAQMMSGGGMGSVASGTNTALPETDQKPKAYDDEESEEAQAASKAGERVDEDDEEETEEKASKDDAEGKAPPKGKKPKESKKPKPKEGGDVSQNSAETITVEQYSAVQGEVKTLREENARLKADNEKAKVKAILDTLDKVEHYEFDHAEVEAEMLPLDDAGREKKAANIRKHNRKRPDTSDTVSVLEGNANTTQLASSADPNKMTAEKFNKAMRLAAQSGGKMTWPEAVEAASK